MLLSCADKLNCMTNGLICMTEDAKIIIVQTTTDGAFTFNYDSLKRGKVTPEECLEALSDPFKAYYDEPPSDRGNSRRFWVGYTLTDRRLELGVEYRKNDIDHIYHAGKAKKETIKKATYHE